MGAQRSPDPFAALPDDIVLRTLTQGTQADDADAIERIWSAEFGTEGYETREWIAKAADPDNPTIGVIAAEEFTEEVVGFGFAFATADRQTVRSAYDPLIEGVTPTDSACELFLGCVTADHQGRGIGNALFAVRLAWCKAMGAAEIWGAAWRRPGDIPQSSPLFERYDFDELNERTDYHDARYGCPECEPDDGESCSCPVALYRRGLDDDDPDRWSGPLPETVRALAEGWPPNDRVAGLFDPNDMPAWPETREWTVAYDTETVRDFRGTPNHFPTPGDWKVDIEGDGAMWSRPQIPPERERNDPPDMWEYEETAFLGLETYKPERRRAPKVEFSIHGLDDDRVVTPEGEPVDVGEAEDEAEGKATGAANPLFLHSGDPIDARDDRSVDWSTDVVLKCVAEVLARVANGEDVPTDLVPVSSITERRVRRRKENHQLTEYSNA